MSTVSRQERGSLWVLGVVCALLLPLTLSSCASKDVPSVVGLSLPRAVKELEDAGFRQVTALDGRGLKISPANYADGYTVTSQDPTPSTSSNPTLITLTTFKKSAPTPAPTHTAERTPTRPTPSPTRTTPHPAQTPTPSPTSTSSSPTPLETTKAQKPRPAQEPARTYYKNCTEARRAGAAPIYRGDPGYRPQLDRDNDGIACE